MERPGRLMVIGLIGLVIGVVVPFLMVLRLVESTFLLNFFAYGASIAGLFIGMLGAFSYARHEREKRRDPWDE
jgi:membrane associated rhomboid family serine protease